MLKSGFRDAVAGAAGKAGLKTVADVLVTDSGEALRGADGGRITYDVDDDLTPPLSQSKWFHASAKAVRMSVLEHLKRANARSQVTEQLRVWADEKVKVYNEAELQKMDLVDVDQIDHDEHGKIKPEPLGFGTELRKLWQEKIDEEVAERLSAAEADFRAEVQAELDAVSDLKQHIKELQDELHEETQRGQQLASRLSKAENEAVTAQSQRCAAEQAKQMAEQEGQRAVEQVKQEYEDLLSKAKAGLDVGSSETRELEAKLQDAERTVGKLQRQLTAAEDEARKAQSTIDDLKETLSLAKMQAGAKDSKAGTKEGKQKGSKDAARKLKDAEDTVKSKMAENLTLKAEIDKLKKELAQAQAGAQSISSASSTRGKAKPAAAAKSAASPAPAAPSAASAAQVAALKEEVVQLKKQVAASEKRLALAASESAKAQQLAARTTQAEHVSQELHEHLLQSQKTINALQAQLQRSQTLDRDAAADQSLASDSPAGADEHQTARSSTAESGVLEMASAAPAIQPDVTDRQSDQSAPAAPPAAGTSGTPAPHALEAFVSIGAGSLQPAAHAAVHDILCHVAHAITEAVEEDMKKSEAAVQTALHSLKSGHCPEALGLGSAYLSMRVLHTLAKAIREALEINADMESLAGAQEELSHRLQHVKATAHAVASNSSHLTSLSNEALSMLWQQASSALAPGAGVTTDASHDAGLPPRPHSAAPGQTRFLAAHQMAYRGDEDRKAFGCPNVRRRYIDSFTPWSLAAALDAHQLSPTLGVRVRPMLQVGAWIPTAAAAPQAPGPQPFFRSGLGDFAPPAKLRPQSAKAATGRGPSRSTSPPSRVPTTAAKRDTAAASSQCVGAEGTRSPPPGLRRGVHGFDVPPDSRLPTIPTEASVLSGPEPVRLEFDGPLAAEIGAAGLPRRRSVANPQKGFRNRIPEDEDEVETPAPYGKATVTAVEATERCTTPHGVPARGMVLERLDKPSTSSVGPPTGLRSRYQELSKLYLRALIDKRAVKEREGDLRKELAKERKAAAQLAEDREQLQEEMRDLQRQLLHVASASR